MNESPKYIARAKDTFNFHRLKLLATDNWTTIKTAKALRRSIGSVSEDLMIARACRVYEKQLEKFKYAYEALEFIREKQKDQDKTEIE